MSAEFVVRGRHVLVGDSLRPAAVHVREGVVVSVTTSGAADPADGGPLPGGPLPDGPAGVEVVELPDEEWLLPGVVDTHVHVNEPGRTHWEGFASATAAAALGGVTCLVDMPLNSVPPTVDVAALAAKRAAAEARVHVDVAFWGGAVPGSLGALEPLWAAGVMGFKCFLADSGVPEFPPLDAAGLDAAAAEIAGFGGLLIVHAEDPAVLAAAPATPGPHFADFVASRPDAAEVVAVTRLVEVVRRHGTRAHVLHLSSARALDVLAAARSEGLPLTVETCPHYLVFDVEGLPDGAAEFKCCPPIRDRGNAEALWDALVDGIIDMVVSDHSPATLAEKRRGHGDLQAAWGGIAGLQVGFTAVADAALARGIGIEQVARWMSAAPAELVGLADRGAIAPGRCADLVRYAPGVVRTVFADRLAHRNPVSAYDGRTLTGAVVGTYVRGRAVAGADDRAGSPGTTVLLGPPSGRLLTRPGDAAAA